MSEELQQKLRDQLWEVANKLRMLSEIIGKVIMGRRVVSNYNSNEKISCHNHSGSDTTGARCLQPPQGVRQLYAHTYRRMGEERHPVV